MPSNMPGMTTSPSPGYSDCSQCDYEVAVVRPTACPEMLQKHHVEVQQVPQHEGPGRLAGPPPEPGLLAPPTQRVSDPHRLH